MIFFALSAAAPASDNILVGNWIGVGCDEGDSGPDLPPPAYLHGIIKFGQGNTMSWSSKLYDDKDCLVPRNGTSTETKVHYSVVTPSVTTDGSVQIDLEAIDDSGATYVMYGLVSQRDGKLYISMYQPASKRPRAQDYAHAQVFTPL